MSGARVGMRDRRDRILDCLLAVGVLYALTLPAVVFLFSAVVRGDRPLEGILKSHLGPLLLLCSTWVGWEWTLALLAPFGIAALSGPAERLQDVPGRADVLE
jgi:hypothetical protein